MSEEPPIGFILCPEVWIGNVILNLGEFIFNNLTSSHRETYKILIVTV